MRAWSGPGPTSRLPPQVTSFVDRERELGEILRLLARPETRLVSLTGPGGVGKTHLALRVAMAVALDTGAPELLWLSLAPMDHTEQLTHAIGEAFALKGSDSGSLSQRLAVALLERRVLLLLDNVEHLQDATALIADLLSACPTLTLLVTSRGPLHLSGEREFALEPLDVPGENAAIEVIAASPAVQLFLQRTPARLDREPIGQEQWRAISAICRRLDGLPLAIELAAAWCRLLTPAQLLTRLDRRLPMLTDGPVDAPARLQTMRDAIGWSFAFLSRSEQDLFCTLCIFTGGFTLEAAEFVIRSGRGSPPFEANEPGAAVRGIAQLLDKGLMRSPQDGRFTILQTIREFGLETLAQSGNLDDIRQAHLSWCSSLVGEPDFEPLDGYIWSESELAAEQDELSAALAYALDTGNTAAALNLASGLAPIWAEQGRYAEARSTLDRIARDLPAFDGAVLAIITGWEAEWAWLQGDYRATWKLAGEALDACRLLKMDAGVAANLYRMGRVTTLSDPPAARPLLEEALGLFRSTGEERASCWCLIALGHIAVATSEWQTAKRWLGDARAALQRFEDGPGSWLTLSLALAETQLALAVGDDDQASELLQVALSESRGQRNLFYGSLALALTCQTALRQNDVASAVSAGREGLEIAQQLGSLLRQWQCLEQLTDAAFVASQPERAVRLHGSALALGERIHGNGPIAAVEAAKRSHIALKDVIEPQRFDTLVRAGRRLTDADVLAEVLALERDVALRQQAATRLSKRELDVLALLAGGATNSAIADQLFLSSRTVDTHVGSILRKLQVTSRLEAIEAAKERGFLDPGEQ